MTTPPPRAYSYIRFSTPEQQTGDSFRRQYELSQAYAELHGLILDERLTYRDLGVSAFDKSNVRDGQLGAFLKAIESGAVPVGSYLLVESLDRISRAKITDALEIFMAIVNRGVRLVTLADGMEYSKEKINKQFTDIIISIAIMSRAHEESLMKSKRLKAAWRTKRANLDVKKLTAISPGWLEISEDRLRYVSVPHKAQLVQDIFDWTRKGIGAASVAKRLNQLNVPTFGARANSMWHTSYIKKILDNRSVLGEFQPHVMLDGKRVQEGEPILDYFPRVISDEVFFLAASSRRSRRVNSAGRKGVGLSNLFSGLLRCGYCHGSMVYVNKGYVGPRGKLLVCSNAKAGKDCHYMPWEYTYFEKSMLTYCTGLDIEQFLQPNEAAKTEVSALAEKITVLMGAIESVQNRESHIFSAIESGGKYKQFEARLVKLEQERSHLELELQSAQTKYERSAGMKIDIAAVRATIEDLMSRMDELTGNELFDLRAELSQQVKRLIARVNIYPGGYIEKPGYIVALREHLLTKGHSSQKVNEFVSANSNLSPNPSRRFFIVASHTASIRIIQPSAEDPEILNFETLDLDVGANIRTHVDSIGVLTAVLENRMKAGGDQSPRLAAGSLTSSSK